MNKSEKLANAHWKYVEKVIDTDREASSCYKSIDLKLIKFHYKSAFIHGYKHGKEGK